MTILYCIIFILLCSICILFFHLNRTKVELRFLRAEKSKIKIDYFKSKCERLELEIKRKNEDFTVLLTENELLKKALGGNIASVIENNNREIQLLKDKILNLRQANIELQTSFEIEKLDTKLDSIVNPFGV